MDIDMSTQISVVIIDQSKAHRESVLSTLRLYANTITVAGSVDNFADGASTIQKASPHVVLLGVDDIEKGIQNIQFITRTYPRVSVIACASESSSDSILALMRAGAVEYLLRPVVQEELKQSLLKVGRFLSVASPPEETLYGEIIAVYNPVGGIGTTTVAVNLAAALATDVNKVALVDLNLQAGDVNTFLNINPAYTLSSVTKNLERLDANFLMSVMPHHPSGPFVLTEPPELEDAGAITSDHITTILRHLKRLFNYVVIDCVGQLEGCNLAIFGNANRILFTTTLTLPALKNAKRYLSGMTRKGYGANSVNLIINRYSSRSDIQIKDAEKVLGMPVYQTIPNAYSDIADSINKGMPVVKLLPRSPISKAIRELAERVKK